MRVLFAVIAAALMAFAQPTLAQAQPAPSTQNLSASHVEAGRDALSAILIDTGALAAGSLQAFTLLAPQFRASITASPVYAALTPDRQRALVAYLDNIGTVGREETLRGAPAVITQFAPSLAALFSESDLAAIAAFMRTPEGGSFFLRSVQEGVQAEATGQPVTTQATPEETAAVAAFEQTPAGAAFNARGGDMAMLMNQVGRASTGAPHIAARFRRDMCEIMGDQCPPAFQQQ